MRVHPSTRPHLDYLCQCLAAAERLTGQEALEALAAFIRVQREKRPETLTLEVGAGLLGVEDLLKWTHAFVTLDPEGGRRGQAFVAASLDLVFSGVTTSRVNDPSRHWPGDVAVAREGGIVTLAAEVKQRPASRTEILQFVARCDAAGIRRAVVAALDPTRSLLDVDGLRSTAWRTRSVHLSLFEGVEDVLRSAITWTSRNLEEALSAFPGLMVDRLRQLEVSEEAVRDFVTRFEVKS